MNQKKLKQRTVLVKQKASEQTFRPKISRASRKIWWRRVASPHRAQEPRRKSATPRRVANAYMDALMAAEYAGRTKGPALKLAAKSVSHSGADVHVPIQRCRCLSTDTLPQQPAARPVPDFPNNSDIGEP